MSKKRREELPEGYAGGLFAVRLPVQGLKASRPPVGAVSVASGAEVRGEKGRGVTMAIYKWLI